MTEKLPSRSRVVLFCRRPALHVGKQRLAAETGAEHALLFARALLDCAVEDCRDWPGPVTIAPSEDADLNWAASLLDSDDPLATASQGSGNLGQRLNHVDRQLRAAGEQRLLYIGSDCPRLTPDYLARADKLLEQYDVVLGPAGDGGVVLMGARKSWPELENLAWETADLGAELEQACVLAGLSVARLETLSDIDVLANLKLLRTELDDPRPARAALLSLLSRTGPRGVSVIIPVRDDHEALDQLLSRLDACRPAVDDITVVDAGERSCAEICERHGVRHLTSNASRGARMNEGAAAATGDILWFLHADAEPAEDAVLHIRRHISGRHSGGWFRFRFAGASTPGRKLLAALINLRARLGIPYADQGLFVERAAFSRVGGFADEPLFEEVALVNGLRRRGNFLPVRQSIGVATRRWDRDGWGRRTLHNRWLAIQHALGTPADELAERYRGAR